MRVLILGGGTVGSSVAKRLCERGSEVAVVEKNPDVAAALDERIDASVIPGDAAKANVLFQAGAPAADVCFALTGSDETNLLGGCVAKAMGSRRVAARVYAPEFRDVGSFDYRRQFNIDRLLSIEYLTAMEIARRVREPGAMLIEHFACGELEMQDVVITKETAATGKPLSELKLPPEARVGAINRDGVVTIASASDHIEVGDRVTLLGSRPQVESAKKTFQTQSINKRDVAIIGGGETGLYVASVLERRNYNATIFERDRVRCEFLASRLKKTTVVCGDGRRRDVLDERRVGEGDVFIACAGDDEYNIMACVEAMELGASYLLAVVRHQDYASVVGKLGINEVVSPFEVVERQVEGLMHKGALVFQNSTLLGGPIEVVELELEENSPMLDAPLKDLGVPRPTLIAAVIRDNNVLIPNANFEFRPYDTVVAIAMPENIEALVNLCENKNKKN
ncbi:MAG: Trk system potassium transporter TrkA [Thermoguttaceae bacterium]|nr:Trk system potassium transporter TrkA [Thermoguttaceae bacterium]